jgi:hypothetical protein
MGFCFPRVENLESAQMPFTSIPFIQIEAQN